MVLISDVSVYPQIPLIRFLDTGLAPSMVYVPQLGRRSQSNSSPLPVLAGDGLIVRCPDTLGSVNGVNLYYSP